MIAISHRTYTFFHLKIAFLTALFIFEVGSLICGVAPTSVVLVIGRAIAGVGAAGIGSGAFISKPTSHTIVTSSSVAWTLIRELKHLKDCHSDRFLSLIILTESLLQ